MVGGGGGVTPPILPPRCGMPGGLCPHPLPDTDPEPIVKRVLSCTPADLTPPSNAKDPSFACTGPWAYSDFVAPCVAISNDPSVCPPDLVGNKLTCSYYKACPEAQFGTAHVDNYTKVVTVTGIFHRGGKTCDDNGCHPPISPSYWDFNTPCTNAGNSYLASVRAENHVYDGSGWAGASLGGGLTTSTAQCIVTAYNVPTYYSGETAACGVDTTRGNNGTYDCSTYKAHPCRPATGPLDPDRSACTVGTTPATLYSAANETRVVLAGSDPNAIMSDARFPIPTCSTCEDLPVVTPADSVAKYNCLAKSTTAFAGRNDTPDLTRVGTDINLLLQLRAADLTPAMQAFALQTFEDHPTIVDSCAIGWTRPAGPFAAACTDAERTQIDAGVSLCGEIAQAAINPDARSQFVTYCTDTVISYSGITDCDGYFNAYQTVMTELQTAMQNSLKVNDNPRDAALLTKVNSVISSGQ